MLETMRTPGYAVVHCVYLPRGKHFANRRPKRFSQVFDNLEEARDFLLQVAFRARESKTVCYASLRFGDERVEIAQSSTHQWCSIY